MDYCFDNISYYYISTGKEWLVPSEMSKTIDSRAKHVIAGWERETGSSQVRTVARLAFGCMTARCYEGQAWRNYVFNLAIHKSQRVWEVCWNQNISQVYSYHTGIENGSSSSPVGNYASKEINRTLLLLDGSRKSAGFEWLLVTFYALLPQFWRTIVDWPRLERDSCHHVKMAIVEKNNAG